MSFFIISVILKIIFLYELMVDFIYVVPAAYVFQQLSNIYYVCSSFPVTKTVKACRLS